jgi:hypothetical protein
MFHHRCSIGTSRTSVGIQHPSTIGGADEIKECLIDPMILEKPLRQGL